MVNLNFHNDHGFIVSHDEIIHFRKYNGSVGINSSVLHQAMGRSRYFGLILGWLDNLDILVSIPNGRQKTHSTAHAFFQHPAGMVEVILSGCVELCDSLTV